MRWLVDVPIRAKLLLIGVLSSAIALLLAGAAIVVYDTYTYTDQKASEISVQAEMLGASVAPALVFNDAKAAEEYLGALKANGEIDAAAVYGADGRLVASYARAPRGVRPPPTVAAPAGHRFGDGELEVFRDVVENGRAAGSVYLRANTGMLLERRKRFGAIILLVLVGSLLVTLPISMRMQRVIADPLQEISRAASRIAAGDLTANPVVDPRRDEIGLLMQTFARMAADLRAQIRELIEGANVLGTAATQIVTASSALTAGASESAAVVGQTATTIEEVRQTAQLASQKAKLVSEIAQKAAQSSESGRRSSEDVGIGMGRIRQQMEAIAVSMERLIERSQAVAEIIATVEDLSAQSNLLAVNAALEAAKAGEHGKGFSVVAQEVRTLAEQSRQATKQVRTILGDIQRATATAVGATESGTQVVEAGLRQAEVAGGSIQALAASVNEAAQAAAQIAASSQQQFVGVGQVAEAMGSIEQASGQNVGRARQLEDAARNLDELGQRMKQLVGVYRV